MAALTPDEEVAAALEASAERSGLRGGHASAANAFERAAALSETSSKRARRLAAAAQAAWNAGQGDRAAGADPACPADRRSAAARPASVHPRGHRGPERLAARRGRDDAPGRGRERGSVGDASAAPGGFRDGRAGARDRGGGGLRFAGRRCHPAGEIDSFTRASLIASAAELSSDYERSRSLSADLVARADGMDVPASLIWASLAAARVGMRTEALHHANRAVSYAREQGAMTTLTFSLQVQAAALIGQSRLELAYASADEGWRLALDTGQLWAASWNLMRLVQIDALRGNEELARAHAGELEALVAAVAPRRSASMRHDRSRCSTCASAGRPKRLSAF